MGAYGCTISRNHFFNEMKTMFFKAVRRICFENTSHEFVTQGDKVFVSGDPAIGMYFVISGHLAYTVSKQLRHFAGESVDRATITADIRTSAEAVFASAA